MFGTQVPSSGSYCNKGVGAYLAIYVLFTLHMLYRILCFADRASLYDLVNKANLVHSFSKYVYLFLLQVSAINTVVSPDDRHIFARNM